MFKQKISLIIKLANALHSYGVAAHNLEDAITRVSTALGVKSQFFATPTVIMASFETVAGGFRHSIVRVQPGDIALEKMLELDLIGDKIISGELDLEQADNEIDRVINSDHNYPEVVEVFAYGILGAATSVLFNAGLNEIFVSFILGMIVGLYSSFAPKGPSSKRMFEFAVAFITCFSAVLIYRIFPAFSINLCTLASLLVFVPGLGLTISMNELATQNLASGTARLMGAIITFFKLVFGVISALYLGKLLFPSLNCVYPVESINENYAWLAMAVAAFPFTVLFKAKTKDSFWMFAAGMVGFAATKFAQIYLDANLIPLFGAFAVTIFANLYARVFKHPSAMIIVPGIILLVPGSLGYKCLHLLLEKNTVLGIETAFQMFINAVSLVAGILVANILLPAKRSL